MLSSMETELYGAATSAPFDDAAEAQHWFDVLARHCADLPAAVAWEEVRSHLLAGAGTEGLAWAAEDLVAYLDRTGDPVGVLREVADPDRQEEYVAAVLGAASSDEPGHEPDGVPEHEPEPVELDQDAWFTYLQQWHEGWDGTEESWSDFRQGFVHWAPEGAAASAVALLEQAEAGDRVAVLSEYGLVGARAEVPVEPPDVPLEPVEPVEPVATGSPEADEVINGLLRDYPDLADMGLDRLLELYAEAAADVDAAESATD